MENERRKTLFNGNNSGIKDVINIAEISDRSRYYVVVKDSYRKCMLISCEAKKKKIISVIRGVEFKRTQY